MTPEQITEMARQASEIELNPNPAFNDFLTRFAKLVRNAALEEATETLYGNGLERGMRTDLGDQIRSLKS